MQEQAISCCEGRLIGVERITKDGMAYRGQVQPDLMRATGDRTNLQPRTGRVCLDKVPAGLSRTAMNDVNLVARWIDVITANRQVDQSGGLIGPPADNALVGFVNLPLLKLPADLALGLAVEGHQDEPRGVTVEPVNHERVWKGLLDPAGQAVLEVRTTAWYREQPRRFVEYQQAVVAVDDSEVIAHGGSVSIEYVPSCKHELTARAVSPLS